MFQFVVLFTLKHLAVLSAAQVQLTTTHFSSRPHSLMLSMQCVPCHVYDLPVPQSGSKNYTLELFLLIIYCFLGFFPMKMKSVTNDL